MHSSKSLLGKFVISAHKFTVDAISRKKMIVRKKGEVRQNTVEMTEASLFEGEERTTGGGNREQGRC